MRETDLAWAAGLIDGEGCVSILRQKAGSYGRVNVSYRLIVKVAMCHRPTLERLAALFGGTIHPVPRPSNKKHSQAWQWWLQARVAESALRALLPHSTTKREEIVLALEFLSLPRFKGGNGRGSTPAWQIEQREAFFQRMKALKRPGASHETAIHREGLQRSEASADRTGQLNPE